MYLRESEMYERIQALCTAKGVTIKQAERDLGWANASLRKTDPTKTSFARIKQLADYLGVSPDALYELEQTDKDDYYTDNEVQKTAQQIFENEDLRLLFDAAKDASAEDLQTVHQMLLALKRKEQN